MDLGRAKSGKHAVGAPKADLLDVSLVDCDGLVVLHDGPTGGQSVVVVSSASQEMTCVRSLAWRCTRRGSGSAKRRGFRRRQGPV